MRTFPPVRLNQSLEGVVLQGHPWLFADAVDYSDEFDPGDVVDVLAQDGDWLARGVIEPDSPIRVRVWTTRREQNVDNQLLESRIRAAVKRRPWPNEETTGYRLLNGEGDRVPGVVCDIYDDVGVLRIDGRAAERWVRPASRLVQHLCDVECIAIRRSEIYRDDKPAAEWLDEAPDDDVTFREHGLRYTCDPIAGQKTGFFLDQRANRRRVARVSRGRRLLNLFGYTGGFSVAAAAGGAAYTVTVDQAKPAIETARRHFEMNDLPSPAHGFKVGDVFDYLEQFGPGSAPFDVAVCDPPSFAHRAKDVPRASEAYVRLYTELLDVMPTGSRIALASCSSQIDRERFRTLVTDAAAMADVSLVLSGIWGADIDHPILPAFPEGDYLQFSLGTLTRD